MKALLMHPDRDFGVIPEPQRYRREPKPELPWHERELINDLELNTLFVAMAGDDEFLLDVARAALLSNLQNDVDTILYRQEILHDCLKNAEAVRELYALAVEAIEAKQASYFGIFTRSPGGILSSSVELLKKFMGILRKLKGIGDLRATQFESRGFGTLFAMLQMELGDEYFATVQNHLKELKFSGGVLLSAELGNGNEGTNYVLRERRDKTPNWIKRLLGDPSHGFTFHLHPRDEAGARALSELQDRGMNLVANAAAQSTEHILSFFQMLKTELGFYVCCLNLRDRLAQVGAETCLPQPKPVGTRVLHFNKLYDVCLALSMGKSIVGNSIDANNKDVVIITGANRGGKSTFLRAIGLAQMMTQCGMFVGAESYVGSCVCSLFTHYKREEDPSMKQGKLDEELSRMSDIVDVIAPNALVLFNESFAATNEREGSEIARQVVRALLEARVRIFFVTHLYEFARSLWRDKRDNTLFLRAEREPNGQRTFKLLQGEPLETSFGADLYEEIFEGEKENRNAITTE